MVLALPVIYRAFTRIGARKYRMPKRWRGWGTTVVETNVHYLTDSSLLGDRARGFTRTMKKKVEKVSREG
jgi:hypothetical protein